MTTFVDGRRVASESRPRRGRYCCTVHRDLANYTRTLRRASGHPAVGAEMRARRREAQRPDVLRAASAGVRADAPDHPVLVLQRAAGNRAVTAVLPPAVPFVARKTGGTAKAQALARLAKE